MVMLVRRNDDGVITVKFQKLFNFHRDVTPDRDLVRDSDRY